MVEDRRLNPHSWHRGGERGWHGECQGEDASVQVGQWGAEKSQGPAERVVRIWETDFEACAAISAIVPAMGLLPELERQLRRKLRTLGNLSSASSNPIMFLLYEGSAHAGQACDKRRVLEGSVHGVGRGIFKLHAGEGRPWFVSTRLANGSTVIRVVVPEKAAFEEVGEGFPLGGFQRVQASSTAAVVLVGGDISGRGGSTAGRAGVVAIVYGRGGRNRLVDRQVIESGAFERRGTTFLLLFSDPQQTLHPLQHGQPERLVSDLGDICRGLSLIGARFLIPGLVLIRVGAEQALDAEEQTLEPLCAAPGLAGGAAPCAKDR